MRMRLGKAFALAALTPLAACGDDPRQAAERASAAAAAPLPRAFEAIGLRGLSWEKSALQGETITLTKVKAELAGVGPVQASEMVVEGYRAGAAGWDAALVRVERVVGSARADVITVRAPHAVREGPAWAVTYASRSVDGYEGPLLGMRASARRAAVESIPTSDGKPAATRIAADGFRVPDGTDRVPALVSGRDWDVAFTAWQLPGGRLDFQVDRARSNGISFRGVVGLTGKPGIGARLSDLGPAVLAPSGWPADVSVASLDMAVEVERPAALGLPPSPDPVAGSLAGAQGPASWHVSATPPSPVPVRDVTQVLSTPGADAKLGLRASGIGLGGAQADRPPAR